MMSTFSELMAEFAKQVPMIKLSVHGEEFRRIVNLTPELDGKERLLYWCGADPDPKEFTTIVRELLEHLSLHRDDVAN